LRCVLVLGSARLPLFVSMIKTKWRGDDLFLLALVLVAALTQDSPRDDHPTISRCRCDVGL
jgi:hypothetical protein